MDNWQKRALEQHALEDEAKHFLTIRIANEVGPLPALMIENFRYWIYYNMANDKHYHDGTYWTYNSVSAFQKIYSYLTAKQIRTILDDLVKDGYLKEGNYSEDAWNKTKWYAFTGKGFKLLAPWLFDDSEQESEKAKDNSENDNSTSPTGQMETDLGKQEVFNNEINKKDEDSVKNGKSNCPTGQIDLTHRANDILETVNYTFNNNPSIHNSTMVDAQVEAKTDTFRTDGWDSKTQESFKQLLGATVNRNRLSDVHIPYQALLDAGYTSGEIHKAWSLEQARCADSERNPQFYTQLYRWLVEQACDAIDKLRAKDAKKLSPTKIYTTHFHDEVIQQLYARYENLAKSDDAENHTLELKQIAADLRERYYVLEGYEKAS